MCNYCELEYPIIKTEEISSASWGWGGELKIKESEAISKEMVIFIDKRDNFNYLRYVDIDDCQCLESGHKIEINFCPFCGEKL